MHISRDKMRRLAGELKRVLRDVALMGSLTWDGQIRARHTLGPDSIVTGGALGRHFLVAWANFRELLYRFPRYFGSGAAIPRKWAVLQARCESAAIELLRNLQFVERLYAEWVESRTRTYSSMLIDAEGWFHLIAELDALDRVVTLPVPQVEQEEQLLVAARRARSVVGVDALISAFFETPSEVAQRTFELLRRFRRVNLRVSWLTEARVLDGAAVTPLFEAIMQHDGKIDVSWLDDLLDPLHNSPQLRETVSAVLKRLAGAVHEIGYDSFAEDVHSPEFEAGVDSPVGGAEINFVPGQPGNQCCSVAVAVAAGDKRPTGFTAIMRRVKTHLITCSPDVHGHIPSREATKYVIVLTDTWDAKKFREDHLDELRAYYRKGVRFLFLMPDGSGRQLSPLPDGIRA